MQITTRRHDAATDKSERYHVLVFAEAGFSKLTIYGNHRCGLDLDVIRRFGDEVNARDDLGTMWPIAPISAMPRRVVRDSTDADQVAHFVLEFWRPNAEVVRSSRVLIDLAGPELRPHARQGVTQALAQLEAGTKHHEVTEVVIVEE